jgi:endonuclease III
MMRETRATALRREVGKLAALYGAPPPPLATDPFEIAVLESAAYLVSDERRRAVFERLQSEVGLTPERLLALPIETLARLIADGGMLAEHRAEKVQKAALVAQEVGVENLRRLAQAGLGHKELRRFPGIAEPGADRILLLARGAPSLAPDSNALRVLVRLGYGEESKDYGRTYRSVAAAVAPLLPDDFDWLIEAHQLLRQHGQEICKRNDPRCGLCPLSADCRWYGEHVRHPAGRT